MKISDLIFIGIKGSVVALEGVTGQTIWTTHLKGSDFVNVVLNGETLLASAGGEIFCLDALTGNVRWYNPLKGFGTGLATFATAANPGGANAASMVEKQRSDAQAAAAHMAAMS